MNCKKITFLCLWLCAIYLWPNRIIAGCNSWTYTATPAFLPNPPRPSSGQVVEYEYFWASRTSISPGGGGINNVCGLGFNYNDWYCILMGVKHTTAERIAFRDAATGAVLSTTTRGYTVSFIRVVREGLCEGNSGKIVDYIMQEGYQPSHTDHDLWWDGAPGSSCSFTYDDSNWAFTYNAYASYTRPGPQLGADNYFVLESGAADFVDNLKVIGHVNVGHAELVLYHIYDQIHYGESVPNYAIPPTATIDGGSSYGCGVEIGKPALNGSTYTFLVLPSDSGTIEVQWAPSISGPWYTFQVLAGYPAKAILVSNSVAGINSRFYRARCLSGSCSKNMLGYMKTTKPQGKPWLMFANQLLQGASTISSILPSPSQPAYVYEVQEDTGLVVLVASYIGGNWDNPGYIVAPGRGVWLNSNGRLDLSLFGYVPKSPAINTIPVNGMRSSALPVSGPVSSLFLQPFEGDLLYQFDVNSQSYLIYMFDMAEWVPFEPWLQKTEAFFV